MSSSLLAGALSSLVFNIGGVNVHATYLQGDHPGCEMAQRRATQWRKEGQVAVTQRVGQWCVAGTLIGQLWVAEQWKADHNRNRAWGWRIQMPLTGIPHATPSRDSSWSFEMADLQLGFKASIRHSGRALDAHHEESVGLVEKQFSTTALGIRRLQQGHIATFPSGHFLLSGVDPVRGAYSIFVQR